MAGNQTLNINRTPNEYANQVASKVMTVKDTGKREPRKYLAKVVENRTPTDGNKISVMLMELLPLTRGHLRTNPVPLKKVFIDALERVHVARGNHNNRIIAEWYTTDTYRRTAPDVQRDENVLVWQRGDGSDIWYWEAINDDTISHRHLETVVHAVNADPPGDPDSKRTDSERTYYTEMSSHNKSYTISTSKANGEVAAYLIQINAGGGSIVIKDDAGNHIELDTVNTKIWMLNAMQTEITCEKNNIKVHCNENYTETIGNNQSSTITGNRTEQVKGNHNEQIQGNKTLEVSGNVNIIVKGNADINVSGNTNLTSPQTTVKGNVKVDGNTVMTGSLTVQGPLAAQGGSSLSGGGTADTLTVTGPVTLNGGTSNGVIAGSYIDT